MKTTIISVLLMFNLISLSTSASETKILGVWTQTNVIATKTGPIALELSFLENELSLKVTCQFQEKLGEKVAPDTLSTSLTTAIELSDSEIKILEEKTSNAENGIKSCRSFVSPTTWTYSLSADGQQLVIDVLNPYMQRLFFIKNKPLTR